MGKYGRFNRLIFGGRLTADEVKRIVTPLIETINLEIKYLSYVARFAGQIPFKARGKKRPTVELIEKIRNVHCKRTGTNIKDYPTYQLDIGELRRAYESGKIKHEKFQLKCWWTDLTRDELRQVIFHLDHHLQKMNKVAVGLSEFLIECSTFTYDSDSLSESQKIGDMAIEKEYEFIQQKAKSEGHDFFAMKVSNEPDYGDLVSESESPYYVYSDLVEIAEKYKKESPKQKETRRSIFLETRRHQRERETIKERDGEIFFGMILGLGIAYRILMMRRRDNDKW